MFHMLIFHVAPFMPQCFNSCFSCFVCYFFHVAILVAQCFTVIEQMLHETCVVTWVVWVLPQGGGEGGGPLRLDVARDMGRNMFATWRLNIFFVL
jgi:hypothetical protein